MTAYEIADLRTALGERLLGIVRVWFTGMFASFAVAYSVGGSLDVFSLTMLIAFYGVLVFILIALMRLAFKQMSALEQDAERLEDRSGYSILGHNMVGPPSVASKVTVALMVISFFVYCAYVYRLFA